MKRIIAFRYVLVILLTGTALTGFVVQTKPGASKRKAKSSQPVTDREKKSSLKTPGIISWYNMTDGYKKAVSEKKMLVVDVYTDWCYWCKVMDAKTYTDTLVIRKMNEHFVAVKFNPEVDGTHIMGSDTLSSGQLLSYLNKGRGMPGYPSTYIWKDLNRQASIAPYSGYIEADPFNQILNSFIHKDQQ